MKKINAVWIILIVFCSLIVIGGIFYLFYRLYINHIYKRKRLWNEITRPLTKKSEDIIKQHSTILIPRQSIMPLIHKFLPNHLKAEQRKMATRLQFDEPPLFLKNLTDEWNEMDTKSLLSLQLMSNRTSYYTIAGQTSYEEFKLDEESLVEYFSMTSSDQLMTPLSSTEHITSISSSHQHSPSQVFYNSSTILLNNEKNNSSNYIVFDKEQFEKINLSNSVSKI